MHLTVGIDWGEDAPKNLPETAEVLIDANLVADIEDPEDYEVALWEAASEAVANKFRVEPNEILWVK